MHDHRLIFIEDDEIMYMSKKGSFKGYSLKTWVRKNKDSIKKLLSGFCGIVALTQPNNLYIQLMFGIGAGYVTKLMLDSIDFYLSEVEINGED